MGIMTLVFDIYVVCVVRDLKLNDHFYHVYCRHPFNFVVG